jgi:carboxyl-terminal processing protease
MLDSITGYIKIDRFAATTYDEFDKALKTLKKQGITQLIVDVRQNPGGYLDAATNIADDFLDDEKLIVYTQGKSAPREDYNASRKGLFEQGRLAILVDESSASASEILAGAVQDWDRGLIVGRRSYGKGLVQEQYDMDDGSGLRLTIAKYYTPSGRSIQRSYAKGKDAYAEAFAKRFESGELTGIDTMTLFDTTKYYTAHRRVVYSGGGIKPDVYVPYDTSKLSSGLLNMMFSDEMRTLIWEYYTQNRVQLGQYKSIAQFSRGFDGKILVDKYVQTLDPHMKRITTSLLTKPSNMAFFSNQVKAQLARVLFRNNGYYAIQTQEDNVVQRALQALRGNTYSEIVGR